MRKTPAFAPRVCEVCGAEYVPVAAPQKTCSRECRKVRSREQDRSPRRRAARLARAREWHRKKVATDPAYRAKHLRRTLEFGNRKYRADPEHREKVKAKARAYYVKREADPVKKAKRQAAGRKWERKQAEQKAVAALAALAAKLEERL